MKREHCTHWGCKEKATHYRSMPCGAVLPVCSGHYEKPAVTSARRAALEEAAKYLEEEARHSEEIAEATIDYNVRKRFRTLAQYERMHARYLRALAALDEKEVGGD